MIKTIEQRLNVADGYAIEFADWLNKERFSPYGNQWTDNKLSKDPNGNWLFYTSKQLYEIFKKQIK
jgi:hypothetical protein